MQQADKFDLRLSVKQFIKHSLNNSPKTFLGYTAVLIPAVEMERVLLKKEAFSNCMQTYINLCLVLNEYKNFSHFPASPPLPCHHKQHLISHSFAHKENVEIVTGCEIFPNHLKN